jgi:hypothetical protein
MAKLGIHEPDHHMHRIPARGGAGGEGQGAREVQWVIAHLLEGLGGARDGRRRLVGNGVGSGGGGERRRGCSGKGMAGLRGWLASRDQGESNKGIVEAGVALWRWVDGGQSSLEMKKGCGGVSCRN